MFRVVGELCKLLLWPLYSGVPFNTAGTLSQWQTSFLWFMTVCHSHNLCTFSLGLVSALWALPTSRSLEYTPPHTHIFLPPETYSSLLLLRQVHYKHRLLGNTQTERNFRGKLKLFGLVQFPISIMAKVMCPVSQSYKLLCINQYLMV